MSPCATHLVLNPASAAGRTGKRQKEILALAAKHLGRDFSLCVTTRPGEAADSAREATRSGAALVVAVGGDGTIQEVVNGFFDGGRALNPQCRLGILNAGTGRGFAQSLGLPVDPEQQMALIAAGRARPVDIGRALFRNGGLRLEERYFVNECQAGIGGEVVRKVGRGTKRLGGKLAFGATALSAAWRYPNTAMSVSIDDGPARTEKLIGIVIANGEFTAGGMQLAPRARLEDGLFNILTIHETPRLERLRIFPEIYSGKHITSSRFSYLQGRTVVVSSAERVAFEADGELWGTLPCRVEIMPGALSIIAPGPPGD